MEVLLSGQAATFAILAKTATIFSLDGSSFELARAEVGIAFQGCNDLRKLTVKDRAEAEAICRVDRAKDRALRFCLLALDSEDDDTLEFVECAERLLESKQVREFVLDNFYVVSCTRFC